MATATKTYLGRIRSARRWLALALAVLITLTGGVLYGSYSQRWSARAELTAAATRLERFPREIGSWKAVEDVLFDESALQMLECAGYVNRRYVNQDSGHSIQLAVIVGPPGPIAVHTPEICFSSRAYELANERTEAFLDVSPSQRHSFWRVEFATRSALGDGLRVYYAWSAGGLWKSSRSPRVEYAGASLLYKIQLTTYVAPHLSDESSDPGRQFLEELLHSAWRLQQPESL